MMSELERAFDDTTCMICGSKATCHCCYDEWKHYCLDHFYRSNGGIKLF